MKGLTVKAAPIRLLIVEDHELTRVGLRLTLERSGEFEIVDEATNGAKAVEIAEKVQPDVVLMDIGLPEIDGIKATQRIKEAVPNAKIIMLTSHDSDDDIFASFGAGADGYCLKDVSSTQLELAIKSAAAGASWLDPSIAARVLQAIPPVTDRSSPAEQRERALQPGMLSDREMQVLELVVDGLSNQEIAEKLVLSVETVKTHMRHIMEKLSVSDRTQAAVKAMRQGLVK